MKLTSKTRLIALSALLGTTLAGLAGVASAAPTIIVDLYFDLNAPPGSCVHRDQWLGFTYSYFCTLNGVQGEFEGETEYGMVYPSGTLWHFKGNSCQPGVGFRVICHD
ncbi:MAG: hypothetical protein N838_08210 [Thiohalocapsa sp. PB-PSB1]|nr:MAG: hypothetical protein N838_08210 [Thiohalocapsa sp. PB-PSB1]